MLKIVRNLIILSSAMMLLASCGSKTKKENVGGVEGQALDSQISSKDISYDSMGSDSGKIEGLNTIHFDYDQSTLTSEARRTLAANADWVKAHPKVTVQIEGHCDARGSVEYNLALGERRAQAVKSYLATLGIDSKRLTIISYGEEKPLDTADTPAAYAKNRRANFVPLAQ